MSIRVLFFAALADAAGRRQAEVDASAFPDAASLYNHFACESPDLQAHRSSLLCSVNSEFAPLDTQVQDGDEVAFFPPVSGG